MDLVGARWGGERQRPVITGFVTLARKVLSETIGVRHYHRVALALANISPWEEADRGQPYSPAVARYDGTPGSNGKGRRMTRFNSSSKSLMWLAALLVAACGTESVSASRDAVESARARGKGPAPVSLGTAGDFAILSKSGITDVPASAITGYVGTSPITGAALLLTCGEVTGKIVVVDAAGPLPCAVNDATSLTAAVGDMETAYLDAEGRVSPDHTELGAGEIGGLTLAPGLYKWGTGLLISSDVTLSGGPNDVWIFQVAGTFGQASATRVTLTGGALPKNIFWQVAGAVTIGTTAHFEGIVLAKTLIAANTGASVNGRLLAQTAVTLQMNAVTQPAR